MTGCFFSNFVMVFDVSFRFLEVLDIVALGLCHEGTRFGVLLF